MELIYLSLPSLHNSRAPVATGPGWDARRVCGQQPSFFTSATVN